MIKKAEKTDADDLENAKEQKQEMANANRCWCPGAAVERRIFCTSCRRTPELATLTNECNCETFVKSTISDGLFREFLNWIS
jgi:hypothetical protein